MNISDLLVLVYGNKWFVAVAGLLALNVAAGIAVSLYLRTFYLATVADWLISRALAYVITAGVLQGILIVVPNEYIPDAVRPLSSTAIWGMVVAALVGHILDTLNQIPSINIPSFLVDKPKEDVSSGT